MPFETEIFLTGVALGFVVAAVVFGVIGYAIGWGHGHRSCEDEMYGRGVGSGKNSGTSQSKVP